MPESVLQPILIVLHINNLYSELLPRCFMFAVCVKELGAHNGTVKVDVLPAALT